MLFEFFLLVGLTLGLVSMVPLFGILAGWILGRKIKPLLVPFGILFALSAALIILAFILPPIPIVPQQ